MHWQVTVQRLCIFSFCICFTCIYLLSSSNKQVPLDGSSSSSSKTLQSQFRVEVRSQEEGAQTTAANKTRHSVSTNDEGRVEAGVFIILISMCSSTYWRLKAALNVWIALWWRRRQAATLPLSEPLNAALFCRRAAGEKAPSIVSRWI